MKEVKTVLELIALNKVQFTTKITAPPRKQRGRQIKSSSRTITESNDSEPKRQNRRGPRRQDSADSDQSPSSSDSLSDLDSEESDSKFLSKLEQSKKPQKLLTKRQRMALEKEEADSQELERLDQQFF